MCYHRDGNNTNVVVRDNPSQFWSDVGIGGGSMATIWIVKHYPKELCDETIVHNDGYPKYCHWDTGVWHEICGFGNR